MVKLYTKLEKWETLTRIGVENKRFPQVDSKSRFLKERSHNNVRVYSEDYILKCQGGARLKTSRKRVFCCCQTQSKRHGCRFPEDLNTFRATLFYVYRLKDKVIPF